MKQSKFDTLKYVNKLEVLGIPRKQAEGQVELLTEIFDENMATKEDIAALKSDMTADIAALKGEISVEFAQVDVKFAQVDIKFANLKADIDVKFAQTDMRLSEMKTELSGMKTELAEFKTMIKWLFGAMLGILGLFATQAGLLLSAMKFWH